MSIDTVVLKCVAPCNLACTYCYEYSAGDETWRLKPKFLAPRTARMVGLRIRELSVYRGLQSFNVVLHGGEPLLLGIERLGTILHELRRAAGGVRLNISLQTNATLISREFCELFVREGIAIGVSVDGGEKHSGARIDHNGHSSWTRTMGGVNLLKRCAPERFAGVLCVVNSSYDPCEVIDELMALGAPTIDLLQPFLSHDAASTARFETARRFGEWMIKALQHWIRVGNSNSSRIRVFDDALRAVCTGRPRTDWFGPRKVSYTVVDTGGAYDLLDQLKAVGAESHSIRDLGSTVQNCSLSEVESLSQDLLRRSNGDILPEGCCDCRWSAVCAAGHLPSRYSRERMFNNPSTYCEGIMAILDECATIMETSGMTIARSQA